MAVRDAKPVAFSRGRQPTLENPEFRQNFSPFSIYTDTEYANIERSLKNLNNLLIQVADAAPDVPLKGMIRYAVSPWDPLGRGDGPVIYDGSAWQLLTAELFTSALAGIVPASGGGTSNFLRADGTWAAPTDTDTHLGVLLDTQTVSGTPANLTFSSISSAYDDLLIEIIGLSHNNAAASIQVAFSENNFTGTKNITGAVRGSGTVTTSATSPMAITGTTFASAGICYGSLLIRQYKNTSASYFSGQLTRSDAAFFDDFSGFIAKAAALNAVRFTPSAGAFDAGSVKLYGLKRG